MRVGWRGESRVGVLASEAFPLVFVAVFQHAESPLGLLERRLLTKIVSSQGYKNRLGFHQRTIACKSVSLEELCYPRDGSQGDLGYIFLASSSSGMVGPHPSRKPLC